MNARRGTLRAVGLGLVAGAVTAACGGSSSPSLEGSGDRAGSNAGFSRDASAADGLGSPGAGQGAGGAMMPPPAEREERRDFEAPRAGANFVYVANPRRDSVAVIDSRSLSIATVQVGDTPTYLYTVPGQDIALVINVGTRDLSVLRTEPNGATKVSTLPLVPGANALSVSPDGKHAVAWYDAANRTAAVGSFQDVAVIKLDPTAEAVVPLTVGFKPTDVVFASDGSAAFVVTEDGISLIRFADVTRPARAPIVRLGGAAGMEPLDVSVTPDGRFAVARRNKSREVLLVDMTSARVTAVDLGGFVTDLDLGGNGRVALAVLRDEKTFVRIAVPEGFSDESRRLRTRLPDEDIASASLAPDGKTAVLYVTDTMRGQVERLVVVDLDGREEPRPVRLRKSVRSVALAPDSTTALVVHNKLAGDPKATMNVEEAIDRSFGYTVVNLKDGFAKLQTTDVDVGPLAITPDGSRAFVLLSGTPPGVPAVRVAQRISLQSFLVDDFALGSPPTSIAALGEKAHKVFVGQSHPEGRISFIDWESGQVQSVTGFELNGRIVQ